METCSTAGCSSLQGTMDDCAAVYEWMKGGIKLIYSLIDGVAVNSQNTGPPPDSIRIQEELARYI